VKSAHEYEDLLSLWSDLESSLGVLLINPARVQEFEQRIWQYDRWMQTLLQRDTDVGLYLLFQLATNSHVGYSASHALICTVLSHLIAIELKLGIKERDSLVHAAFTMNIAMTALQDELAGQLDKPNPEQQTIIRAHAVKGSMMLNAIGVMDKLWIDVVSGHHDESADKGELRAISPADRLARILRIVDRYAAMISPRKSRTGRNAIDSVRAIISASTERNSEVGHALVRTVGLCPPGTYVRLDNNETAVVLRRSSTPNHPHVAIVIDGRGEILSQPRLHRTAEASPRIQVALAAASVQSQLNHHLVLQLGAYAAQHS
jgi:HD-GYP domain-containing protein (c-di-GMP phosphodiesterase class II)